MKAPASQHINLIAIALISLGLDFRAVAVEAVEVERAKEVCIALGAYFTSAFDRRSAPSRSHEFKSANEKAEHLREEDLKAVQQLSDVEFLPKRIAFVLLEHRKLGDLDKKIEPPEDRPHDWESPPVRKKREHLFIQNYAMEANRGWWEFHLLFPPAKVSLDFEIRGLCAIHSPESLPLLASVYEWRPHRLSETGGSATLVRKQLAFGIGQYHTKEALEVLADLWKSTFVSEVDRRDLINTVALDEEWQPVITKLPDESRSKLKKFLDSVEAEKHGGRSNSAP